MRVTSILLILVMALSFAGVTAQDKPDFSGTWIMNADKSDMGNRGGGGRGGGRGGRGMGGGNMTVVMKDNMLTTETTRQNRDGDDVTTITKYTLDGKESKNESQRGESISTAKWSKDGKSLVIYTEMYISFGDREMTIESEATWSLDKDMLKIKTIRSTQRGESETTMAYDKEK